MIFTSFGDMMRVPAATEPAGGEAGVRMCLVYSPLDALPWQWRPRPERRLFAVASRQRPLDAITLLQGASRTAEIPRLSNT